MAFNTRRKNTRQKTLAWQLILLALLCICPPLNATGWNTSADTSNASTSSRVALSDAPVQFLAVEDAYQLTISTGSNQLYLNWDIAPTYYLYKHKFSLLAIEGEKKTRPLSAQYPSGRSIYDDYYEKELEVYYNNLQVIITLPEELEKARWTLSVTSQGCADAGLCYPPRTQYFAIDAHFTAFQEIESPRISSKTSGSPATPTTNTTEAPPLALPLVLLFALLGGMILNLMPCVFPVLSIKVLSLTSAHLSSHNKHMHGLAYTAGIILSFIAIAGLLLIFRQAGQSVGWGFQLQSPLFVSLLAYLFFSAGLSFSGILIIGAKWMGFGQSTTTGTSLRASFMTGILATVVASPCSAPFMGTALGVALTQTPIIGLLIFSVLGLGMALPFVLLSWVPGLLEKLPSPGPWMETFRQFLAFPLYASAIWLLWVLARQTSINHATVVSLGILLLAFAAWLWGHSTALWGKLTACSALAIAFAIAFAPAQPASKQNWEPYSRARLDELQHEGQAVFVNLTADWCITCLANEKIALSSNAFTTLIRDKNITYLKGDWTNRNPEISKLLFEYGRSGVPLYLYYAPGSTTAKTLPQLLTPTIVTTALSASPCKGKEPC